VLLPSLVIDEEVLWQPNASGWTAVHFAVSHFLPMEWFEWILQRAADRPNQFFRETNSTGPDSTGNLIFELLESVTVAVDGGEISFDKVGAVCEGGFATCRLVASGARWFAAFPAACYRDSDAETTTATLFNNGRESCSEICATISFVMSRGVAHQRFQ
jgi:hypothetical protein